MTERFNPIPKRLRPVVYSTVALAGLAAAACGGTAEGKSTNGTGKSVQSVGIEQPTATATAVPPTPEPTATPVPLVIPDVTKSKLQAVNFSQVIEEINAAYTARPDADKVKSVGSVNNFGENSAGKVLTRTYAESRSAACSSTLTSVDQRAGSCFSLIIHLFVTAKTTNSPEFLEAFETAYNFYRNTFPQKYVDQVNQFILANR
jgi:hypothetical protein